MLNKLMTTSLICILTFMVQMQSVFAAPEPAAFGVLPKVHDAAISPNGLETAAIMNLGGVWIVRVFPTTGLTEEFRAVRLANGVKPHYIKWVSNDRVIVKVWNSEELKGKPFTTGFLFSIDTKVMKAHMVVRPKNKVFRQYNGNVVDWLENDPNHILMSFDEYSNNESPEVKRVNITKTNSYSTIQRGSADIQNWVTDQNGKVRIGFGLVSGNGIPVMRIKNLQSGEWDSVETYPGLTATTRIFGVIDDDLMIGDYGNQDTLGIAVYNLGQKRITRRLYQNDNYDVSGLIMNKDGTEVIGVNYIADSNEREIFGQGTIALDNIERKKTGYKVEYFDQTGDGQTLLVNVTSATDPGGLYSYSTATNELKEIIPMRPALEKHTMGQVLRVTYKSRDDQNIPAFMTLPPGMNSIAEAKNIPFIVLPHGGPYARDSLRFDYFAQFFATRGYGVLQMNFRGSEGYGKSYSNAGRNNWIVMQDDVEDGARWLLERGHADANRLCIAGWSYGGYAALMGAIKTPDLYKCSIAMAAMTDIENQRRHFLRYSGTSRKSARNFFGDAMRDKDVREQNSPVSMAKNITVPVFLAHGTFDQKVPFDQYEKMKKAMKKARVDGTYVEFKAEDHFLSHQPYRQEFFQELDKFLTKVNGKSEYMK